MIAVYLYYSSYDRYESPAVNHDSLIENMALYCAALDSFLCGPKKGKESKVSL